MPRQSYLPEPFMIYHDEYAPKPLACDLYFEVEPKIDIEAILSSLSRNLGPVEYTNSMFIFPGQQGEADASKIYFRIQAEPCDFTPEEQEQLPQIFGQSWYFPQAADVLQSCRYRIILEDFMILEHWTKRLFYLYNVLMAILENVSGIKILHWVQSQNMVEPWKYLEHCKQSPVGWLLGPISVRKYRIEGKSDVIVDTLGLSVLSLFDLQCHINHKLNPYPVMDRLFSYATSVVENGNIFMNGQTVDGVPDTGPWICNTEISLLGPERPVVDFYPGIEFSPPR